MEQIELSLQDVDAVAARSLTNGMPYLPGGWPASPVSSPASSVRSRSPSPIESFRTARSPSPVESFRTARSPSPVESFRTARSRSPSPLSRGPIDNGFKFFTVPNVADAVSGAAALTLGQTHQPVVWWAFFPPASVAAGMVQTRPPRLKFQVPTERNPILTNYFDMTGLPDLGRGRGNNAVKKYYDTQNAAGFGEAFGLVQGALIGGHLFERETQAISEVFAWVFNSAIHVRALAEVGFSVWNLFDSRLFSTRVREINEFLTIYIGMKTGRALLRLPHAALPSIPNDDILRILFGATVARLGAGATVGSFIQTMAQIVHFRAYQECGHLPRYDERRWTITVDGRRSITSAQPVDVENTPYSRLVRAIFSRDTASLFRTYPDEFIDDIIADPAGWNAIAHRLVVL